MLDDYKEKQPIMYKKLKNVINNNLSHAFLFVTNKNIYSEKIITSFAKAIICPKKNTQIDNCGDCNICNRIDSNKYSEIKFIKQEGLLIKKSQLLELQKEFTTKPIEGLKRVYVIYEAEKLNKQAANSILKFLEEPADDIVAILVTDNYNLMLETIISRCQTILFNNNNIEDYVNNCNYENKTAIKIYYMYHLDKEIEDYMSNDENIIIINNIVKFVEKYEELKKNMINNTKKYFHNYFSTKEEVYYFFEIVGLLYKDIIEYKIKKKINIFDEYIDIIDKIANKNQEKELINKLNKILLHKESIKSNVNINLLVDKLIIDLEGGIK